MGPRTGSRGRSRPKSRDRLNPTMPGGVQSVQSTLKNILSSQDTWKEMDGKLNESGWYQENLIRSSAETILSHEPIGTFIITAANSMEWTHRLQLMQWKNGAVLVGNVCRELLLRTEAEVQRWPI